MAFDNSFTAVTGATYTAAQYNTHVKGNFTALWVGTTNGDLDYYTSSTAKTRLAIGASGTVLTSNGTIPTWAVAKNVNARAIANWDAGEQTITNTSYTDVTNATVNITTTATCTIFMIATGVFATNFDGNRGWVAPMIGGVTLGDTGGVHTSSGVYVPFTTIYYRTGATAGTITCKLQGRANAGGNAAIFERGRIIVFAFTE